MVCQFMLGDCIGGDSLFLDWPLWSARFFQAVHFRLFGLLQHFRLRPLRWISLCSPLFRRSQFHGNFLYILFVNHLL